MRSARIAPVLLLALAPASASALPPTQVIAVPGGPLKAIYAGNEGSTQIVYSVGGADADQVYPPTVRPGDYGTFIAVNGVLHAPNFLDHQNTATQALGSYVPFSPISQTTSLGTGTSGDPFRIVTVYDVGATGLQVTQTDEYVAGQESYLTTILISSSSMTAVSGVLYRAADCYLGGSDEGYGFSDASAGSVGCSQNANNSPVGLVEQWLPITPGNTYFEAGYDAVWRWIATQQPFPSTCMCSQQIDNGAGISWVFTVPPLGTETFVHVTTFSPVGKLPVSTTVVADRSASVLGAPNGYTLTLTNPNAEDVNISAIVSQLPLGFTFTMGTTTGVLTEDPTINGQALEWSSPLTLASMTSIAFHFDVTVSTAPGTYYNNAGAMAADGFAVSPAANAAPIVVVDLRQRADAAVLEDASVPPRDASVPPADSGARDAAADAMVADAEPPDAGARDAMTSDSGTRDAMTSDSGARDAMTSDSGARDAMTSDTGSRDASALDASSLDASSLDASSLDASVGEDAAEEDAAEEDAAEEDSGDPGAEDAGDPVKRDDDEGCGCSTQTTRGTPPTALLAIGLAVLVRRRRR